MKEASSYAHRSMVLLLALAFDWIWREPPAWAHPVVWLGKLIDLLVPAKSSTSVTDRDRIAQLFQGAFIWALTVVTAYLTARIVELAIRRLPGPLGLLAGAIVLKPAFAVEDLVEASAIVESRLHAGDMAGARASLTTLVSRDVASLDEPLVAAGAIESLAENLNDSFVGPASYFLMFGLPGAFAYRAANTLDSMIGYRGRYEYLGKISARADDLANLVTSRMTAVLIVGAAALNRLDWPNSLLIALRDQRLTESPNAGWPMGAMAGALNVRLEKPDDYRLGAEFGRPEPADINRAARVARSAVWLCWALAAVAALAFERGKFFRVNSSLGTKAVGVARRG